MSYWLLLELFLFQQVLKLFTYAATCQDQLRRETICGWEEMQVGDRLTDMGQLETSSRHLAWHANPGFVWGKVTIGGSFCNCSTSCLYHAIYPYISALLLKPDYVIPNILQVHDFKWQQYWKEVLAHVILYIGRLQSALLYCTPIDCEQLVAQALQNANDFSDSSKMHIFPRLSLWAPTFSLQSGF